VKKIVYESHPSGCEINDFHMLDHRCLHLFRISAQISSLRRNDSGLESSPSNPLCTNIINSVIASKE